MASVVLFHHAQGLTPGVLAFAERIRSAGHTVYTPDLYEGASFDSLDAGIAHVEEIGFDTVVDRGRAAATALPADVVYIGFSLGVLPAQMLAQTRPDALGVVAVSSVVPGDAFGDVWPTAVPLQIHAMTADPLFTTEGDSETAEGLVASVGAELFLYPGEQHLFVDDSLPGFDGPATELLLERVLSFVDSR
ncbi:dienelactone hydrolase family protein [Microbacteriaceae bacterium VKM Ac-2855]|nr:dienelactone hydrolase family protein [Microbacteriaceae bacterium VKM Ac-2855]